MSFEKIKGLSRQIDQLKSCIEGRRVASSYLFAGPEGIGKNLLALEFAKALNCENGALDSCDTCASCRKIQNRQHPDVHIIDALSQEDEDSNNEVIKIEKIRGLKKDMSLKPYEAKTKVFIIDNAHRLTAEASNCLLKVLEESPGAGLIILVTHKPALLFKTIVSRCSVIKFSPFPREELEAILKEKYAIEGEKAHFLSYFSEGRLGYALRLKDTDIINEKNRAIDDFSVDNVSFAQDAQTQNREQLQSRLNLLAVWFRDMYIAKAGMPHSEIINYDRRRDLLKCVERYSFADLDRMLKSICDAILYLQQNINIRLLLSNLKYSLK